MIVQIGMISPFKNCIRIYVSFQLYENLKRSKYVWFWRISQILKGDNDLRIDNINNCLSNTNRILIHNDIGLRKPIYYKIENKKNTIKMSTSQQKSRDSRKAKTSILF